MHKAYILSGLMLENRIEDGFVY